MEDIEALAGNDVQNDGTQDQWRPQRRASSIVSRPVTLSPAQQAMETEKALSIHSIPQTESLRSVEPGESRTSSQFDRKPATASLSTRIILQNFERVVAQEGLRQEDIQYRREQTKKALEKKKRYRQTFEEFKEHIAFGYKPIFNYLPQSLFARSIHPMPKKASLDEMVRAQYPARSEIKVRVCDFGPGRFDSFWTTVGKVQDYWLEKPDWVTVRWINIPCGYGMLQSSLEDMFNHAGERGRPFERAGSSDWPFVAIDVLCLKHRDDVLFEREGHAYLSQQKAYENGPTESVFDGMSNELKVDLEWRANHLGSKVSFWDMVSFDFSRELQEGKSLAQDTPSLATLSAEDIVDEQVFSSHPLYENVLLMRNYFRAFHRSDGYLLTFSQIPGVDYLDRELNEHLKEPPDLLLTNDDASGVAHVAQAFIETGTDSWHRKSVEWLLVYIMTEMAVTPHNIRKGRQGLSIMGAYRVIAQDLKRRRNAPWKKDETVKLVRAYLRAIDELTAVKSITGQKLHVFQGMVEDCERMENEDDQAGLEINPYGESAIDRVQWALQIVKEMDDDCTKLLSDLQVALNELFQLRSIEQNELAIITDAQNKAILLFTGVTIIFLPLSFFTSYFGMNLQGIQGTNKDEAYFWKTCGSFSFVLILVICLYGFRQSLLSQFLHLQRHVAPRT